MDYSRLGRIADPDVRQQEQLRQQYWPTPTPTPPPAVVSAGPPERRFLQPTELRRLRNFQFATKLIVEGYFQGRHRSPFYDFSSEFADYRPYVPGDEIRSIDWRAYARTDRYYIKLYRKETDMNCYLLVDTSRSMAFKGDAGVSKLEYAGYTAAALSYLILRQGDKAGLSLGGERLTTHIPAGGTRGHLNRILTTLEHAVPTGKTGLGSTLQTLFGALKRRGLLVVISDFLDDPDRIFSALGMFTHRGFSVLLFQVLTDDELHLPQVNNALFQDMESQAHIAAEPQVIRSAYEQELGRFLDGMAAQAKARRIYYHLASTSTPYYHALEAYLTTRSSTRL